MNMSKRNKSSSMEFLFFPVLAVILGICVGYVLFIYPDELEMIEENRDGLSSVYFIDVSDEDRDECKNLAVEYVSKFNKIIDGYHVIGSESEVVFQKLRINNFYKNYVRIEGSLLMKGKSLNHLLFHYDCAKKNENGDKIILQNHLESKVLSHEDLVEFAKENISSLGDWQRIVGETKEL